MVATTDMFQGFSGLMRRLKGEKSFESNEDFVNTYRAVCEAMLGKSFEKATDRERYQVLARMVAFKARDLQVETKVEQEKEVYAKLLSNPDEQVTGTVAELAERYDMDPVTMAGFLDGINESLVTPNEVETVAEDTVVNLIYDKEKLYKNMVKADAEWLYGLPQWDAIYDEETRKNLYLEQKKSRTIVKGKKIGRNDPCPCGSGKKYKQCCGRA